MIATRHMNLFTFKLFNNKYNKSSIALVIFQVLNKPPAASGRRVDLKHFLTAESSIGQKVLY